MFFGFPHLFDEDDLLEKQLEEDENSTDEQLKCEICGCDTVVYLSAFPASNKTPIRICPKRECKK